MRSTVRDFLTRSPAARAVAELDLGAGRAVAIWENRDDRVLYEDPRGHAFSLYLKGGTGTRRLDAGPGTGRPGAVCIMPDGHRSDWEITTPFRFVHLYLPDDVLRAAYATIHDRDARSLDLQDATFAELPSLAAPLTVLGRAAVACDVLMADCGIAELVAVLGPKRIALRGGLAPHLLRRVDDWIDAHLDEVIHLDDLAAVVDLSKFHFHRMFGASRGMAPHRWIAARRIERAKDMLRGPAPIIEIAMSCGFSSQSHFTRSGAWRVHYRGKRLPGRIQGKAIGE